MSLLGWILLFGAGSLFCLWVLRWGGADWLEGWRAGFLIPGPGTGDWSAEQIKLGVLLLWALYTPWFVAGLFVPAWRSFW
ncbi:hypothetical protein [Xylophilus sp. ASV27]|uniref:hypothetical protein n=1 Tax=Xylophilus sp. ASV27 TaxID=2795129 RepID=UPI0018EC8A75|nr:hypothetical protein [Xylophilus sp. ASV27]